MKLDIGIRTSTFGGIILLVFTVLVSAGVAKADTIILGSSEVAGNGQFCFRNNNGTTGIQVTLGAGGVCPRTNPVPNVTGPASSSGPGPATAGTYTLSLVGSNTNTPAFNLVRVGSSSNFNVSPSVTQFNFVYQTGGLVHVTGTVRFTQFTQGSGANSLTGVGQFTRTGGTSPQFNAATATLLVHFSVTANESLVDLWTDIVTQDPNDPDHDWKGLTSKYIFDGELTPNLIPTAALVQVSGRVVNPNGTGIGRVVVTLADTRSGATRTTQTNSFGAYTFANVEVGSTYMISVSSKRYSFDPPFIIRSVVDELQDADFVSVPF